MQLQWFGLVLPETTTDQEEKNTKKRKICLIDWPGPKREIHPIQSFVCFSQEAAHCERTGFTHRRAMRVRTKQRQREYALGDLLEDLVNLLVCVIFPRDLLNVVNAFGCDKNCPADLRNFNSCLHTNGSDVLETRSTCCQRVFAPWLRNSLASSAVSVKGKEM